ncbi:MAG: hypothetical protein K1566_09330 [Candidatus Thiodiazotropha sp. (ex. Lucinisca nassula)]|nr:hypothetical protein [Candidatus Thiodiazotropha sp. (ex. Lucinisca nassula)]MBW9269831.1 hypothetical protein [Candidatus Thiodiazotropha sp. (ex. Lucinisca nassula)]
MVSINLALFRDVGQHDSGLSIERVYDATDSIAQVDVKMVTIVTDRERYWVVGVKQNFVVNEGLLGKMPQSVRQADLDHRLRLVDRVCHRFASGLVGAVSQASGIDVEALGKNTRLFCRMFCGSLQQDSAGGYGSLYLSLG